MNIRQIIRYIKFHLVFKRRYSKTPGIPTLCTNINHPFHESKFEAETCEVLSSIFPKKDVWTPTNHKYHIKFDFIIKNTAIIEPHGIWSNRPGEDTYFDYYKQRRGLADKEEELKNLPVVVLSSTADLGTMKRKLTEQSSNYKKTFQELTTYFLDKHKTSEINPTTESPIRLVNWWLLLSLILSTLLNFYLFFN